MIDRAHLEAKRGEHTHYVVPTTVEKRCCLCLSIWPCEQSQILDLALSADTKDAEITRLREAAKVLDELDWCIGYELLPHQHEQLDKARELARAALEETR